MNSITKSLDDRLLDLPAPKERVEEIKRFVGDPDLTVLNLDQSIAMSEIFEECISGPNPMHLLLGYAGTGKTFLTALLIETILHQRITGSPRIAVAAPTNKAVKVIKDNCPIKDTRLKFATIHSFLGLKERIDGYGRQTFVQDKKEDAKLEEYNILIVDETSMLADELFDMLDAYTSNGFGSMKIIFIGDPAQIPPVGKADCIPFTEEGQKEHNIGVSRLTKIVRQAEANPLIGLSMKMRENLKRPDPAPCKENLFDDVTMDGVFYLDMNKRNLFHNLLDTYFNSQNYLVDSDFVKIIGWRNATVKTFNDLIRAKIYGKGAAKLCVGERLICNKPVYKMFDEGSDDQKASIYTTNDEITVLGLEVKTSPIRDMDLTYYIAKVKLNGMPDDTFNLIRILHEDSDELFSEYLKYLAELAKNERKGSWEAATKWKDFYKFQELFADVNYSYAITGHKSQGSTYDNVFVLTADIDANRKIVERNRIKYTSYTRPKNKLFIVE